MCGIVGFTGKNEAAPILLNTEAMIQQALLSETAMQRRKSSKQRAS